MQLEPQQPDSPAPVDGETVGAGGLSQLFSNQLTKLKSLPPGAAAGSGMS
jgi:hypothetical protein